MLLAEKVASTRLYDEFGFWEFSLKTNDRYLWSDEGRENGFRFLLSDQGSKIFKKMHLETVIGLLNEIIEIKVDKEWLNRIKERYLI